MRIRRSVGGMSPHSPNGERSPFGEWTHGRADPLDWADFPRFAPVLPRKSQALDPAAPGEARAFNRVPAWDDPAAPPGPPPADPGF